ncbi:hypothetical protein [Aliikangiella maris]|uniref:Uncharacterized protein n=2 Tax=Aliikangiella maris TaxID=3162458 RepID=A0ABV3MQJ8_9GAMM
MLVVDDNATNREVMLAQLTQWGAEVVLADSGEAALQYLTAAIEQDNIPKIAFLDM